MMYAYVLQRGFFANICNHEVAAMLALVDGVYNDSVCILTSGMIVGDGVRQACRCTQRQLTFTRDFRTAG